MKYKSLIKKLVRHNHIELAKTIFLIVNKNPNNFDIGNIQYLIFLEYEKTSDSALHFFNRQIEQESLIYK